MGKVLILQPGIQRYRIALYKKLLKKFGDDLEIWCGDSYVTHDNLRQVGLEGLNVRFDAYDKRIGKVLVQKNIDYKRIKKFSTVVIVGNPRYITNIPVILWCLVNRKRIVWWGQGWSAKSSQASYLIRKLFMKLCGSALLYTESEYEQMKKEWLRPKEIYYTNNGLDLEEIDANKVKVSGEKEGTNFVFVGRFTKKANLPLLLKAFAKAKLQKSKLHIIGDGENKAEYQKMAYQLSINQQIIWYGALNNEADIAKVMCQCDFFVYPGAVGLSLIHAFSYSLPAIIHENKRAHMPEACAFENEGNGYTFHQDSLESLADTLIKVTNLQCNESNSVSLGAKARATVEMKFNTDVMSENFVQAIAIGDKSFV